MKRNLRKIIGVIPARYESTRFPGKPLRDICGKPMVWWVYQQIKKVKTLTNVYVATDDERIIKACECFNMNAVLTKKEHKTHLDRLAEFADIIDADFYINVNGDEPLINPKNIAKLIPSSDVNPKSFYMANAMTKIKNPIEVVDNSRIKITTDKNNYGLYMARTPIPYPKGDSDFTYKKFVGIQCFSKSALNFCKINKRGKLENTEDIDEFRFLENGEKIKFVEVDADSFSVDTPKDLEKVIRIISKNKKTPGGGDF